MLVLQLCVSVVGLLTAVSELWSGSVCPILVTMLMFGRCSVVLVLRGLGTWVVCVPRLVRGIEVTCLVRLVCMLLRTLLSMAMLLGQLVGDGGSSSRLVDV